MYSVKDCIQKLKEVHPDLYPIWYIEDSGNYMFNMLKKGVSRDEATSNFYVVDSKTGETSGSIPVMTLYSNEKYAAKLQHPHKVSLEDQGHVVHSAAFGTGWAIQFSGNYLEHHGIKGQKWGIRRFQNLDGTLTEAGKKHYGIAAKEFKEKATADAKSMKSGEKSSGRPATIGSAESKAAREKEKAENKERYEKMMAAYKNEQEKKRVIYEAKTAGKKLSLREKAQIKQAIEADFWSDAIQKETPKELIDRSKTKESDAAKNAAKSVATDLALSVINPFNLVNVAADGMAAGISSAREKKYLKEREANSVYDEKSGFYKKKEGQYSEKEDLAAVNPRYMDYSSTSKNNCMLCTTTYDLRQRGYDVTAQFDSVGYTFGDLKRWYPKVKMERTSRFDSNGNAISQKQYVQTTIDALKKQGDGARGNLMVMFNMGGGHSIAYEVKNGELVFKDGQVNMKYGAKANVLTNSRSVEQLLNMTTACAYARLDNVEPDLKRIKAECCR